MMLINILSVLRLDRWLKRAAVFLSIVCAACIPVPNRVRDTPAITGGIMAGKAYASGLEVASMPEPDLTSVPPTCGVGGASAITDEHGMFTLEAHRHWDPYVFLLGESPEWRRSWALCVRQRGSGRNGWRVLYRARSNLWEPVTLACDTLAAWREDTLRSTSGRCTDLHGAPHTLRSR